MTNPVMVVRAQYGTDNGQRIPLGRSCWVWCPGCNAAHSINVVGEDGSRAPITWEWDGNTEQPTFSPSIMCHNSAHLCPPEYVHTYICEDPDGCGQHGHLVLNAGSDGEDHPTEPQILGHMKEHAVDPGWGTCHSYLTAGRWRFLGDCAHKLAGQTVDMVPLPDWLVPKD